MILKSEQIQFILSLFKSGSPLGETPSLLAQLEAGNIVLSDVPKGSKQLPHWKREVFGDDLDLGSLFGNRNKTNMDFDDSEYEVSSEGVNIEPKQKTHTINPAYFLTTSNVLRVYKQLWDNMLPSFKSHNMTVDQQDLLAHMVDFFNSQLMIASSQGISNLAKEFQSYKGTSLLPSEVKNLPNPFVKLENDFLNGLLTSEIKTFVKKYPKHLPDFLNDVFDRNIQLFDTLAQSLPQSNAQTNAQYFISNIQASSIQKDILEKFFYLSLASEYNNQPNVFEFIESQSSFKLDEFSDQLDEAFGVPAKTFQSVFKPETGLVHKRGLTGLGHSYREEKPYSSIMKKAVLNDFKFFFTEQLDFLKSISTHYLQQVDVSDLKLTKEDLSHIGQDVDNLVVALKQSQDQNFKILITGKPGSGKTSLVHYALKNAEKLGITLPQSSIESYEIENLRGFSPVLGLPVLFVDGADVVSSDELVKIINTKSPTTEIWTSNDPQHIKSQSLSSFDLIIDIPSFPYEKRKALALKLFEDEKIADKISKVCSTPGEIQKIYHWSKMTGQNSWKELSVIANNIVQASIKSKTDALGKNLPLTLHQPSETNYGFDKVVGYDNIVQQAQKMISGYHNPQSFKQVNAKPPKGILLTGGPGLGKTYLVKAMAHEAGVPLLIASSSALSKDPQMITAVFAEARRQAPCILFLDEIDALGASGQKRDGSAADPERQAILNRLLTEIDGFEGLSDVMVIGATHRADVLDEALTRSGRLGWNINFKNPDFKSRLDLWNFYTKDTPKDPQIDFNRITRLSVGMSPADINEAANIASLNAAFENKETISQTNLEKAIDQVEWGLTDDNKEMVHQELHRTAVHEAGHAVASFLLDQPIERINIRPTHGNLGFVQRMLDEAKVHRTEEDLKKDIQILFAGTLAEEIVLKSRSFGASSDLGKIRELIQTMHREEGMGALPEGVDFLEASPQTKRNLEVQEQAFAKTYKGLAQEMLEKHKSLIEALAEELVKNRELNSDEVLKFFDLNAHLLNKSVSGPSPKG